MTNGDYSAQWIAYRESVSRLYAQPVGVMAERGAGGIPPSPDLDMRAQSVVNQSRLLKQSAAKGLALPREDQRELARLQLLAGAAMDLAIANDLASGAGGPEVGALVERGATLPGAISGLQSILSASPEQGIQVLVAKDHVAERGAEPTDPASARTALRDAVDNTIADIMDDATAIGQAAFVGLTAIPMPPVQEAASAVLGEVLLKLSSNVAGIITRAVSLIIESYEKILIALGKDTEDELRKQAAEWVKDLQTGTLIGTLLKKTYETDRIQKDVTQALDKSVAASVENLNKTTQQVSDLATRFRKQKETLTLIIRGLTFARPWLLSSPPWGPLGLTAGFIVTIGYVVYNGGDYVDWFRTGTGQRLDFVVGVRSTVHKTLSV
jgi:histone H3/H4